MALERGWLSSNRHPALTYWFARDFFRKPVPTPRIKSEGCRDQALAFLVAVLRDVAGIAVIPVRQELARHGDLHTITLRVRQPLHGEVEVDRGHDPVAEFFLDQGLPGRAVDHHQLVKAVDQRIGRRHWHFGSTHRYLVEHRGFGL